MKTLIAIAFTTAFATVGLFAALATAQLTPASASEAANAATSAMTEGEVRKIDKDSKKVTLKHGPIKNLDMPGMTMVFAVKDSSLLDKIQVGSKVVFSAE